MTDPAATVTRVSIRDPVGRPRAALVLRLDDGLGNTGWGEASPLPGYSPDGLEEVEQALSRWRREWAGDEGRPLGADRGFSDLPSAACAIETALLDLRARGRGWPMHRLLLEELEPRRAIAAVPVCALVALPGTEHAGTPPASSDTLHEVRGLVANGFESVKFKLAGEDAFEVQLQMLRTVRDAFPDLSIRLDANGAWSPGAAPRILEWLAEIDPEFVEQPVPAADLVRLTDAPVRLAADESLRLVAARSALLDSPSIGALVLKPMVLGGPGVCIDLARAAFLHGQRAISSHTFGGPIAHAATAELALALAAADPVVEAVAAGLAGHDELAQRAGPVLVPCQAPGHGVRRSP